MIFPSHLQYIHEHTHRPHIHMLTQRIIIAHIGPHGHVASYRCARIHKLTQSKIHTHRHMKSTNGTRSRVYTVIHKHRCINRAMRRGRQLQHIHTKREKHYRETQKFSHEDFPDFSSPNCSSLKVEEDGLVGQSRKNSHFQQVLVSIYPHRTSH